MASPRTTGAMPRQTKAGRKHRPSGPVMSTAARWARDSAASVAVARTSAASPRRDRRERRTRARAAAGTAGECGGGGVGQCGRPRVDRVGAEREQVGGRAQTVTRRARHVGGDRPDRGGHRQPGTQRGGEQVPGRRQCQRVRRRAAIGTQQVPEHRQRHAGQHDGDRHRAEHGHQRAARHGGRHREHQVRRRRPTRWPPPAGDRAQACSHGRAGRRDQQRDSQQEQCGGHRSTDCSVSRALHAIPAQSNPAPTTRSS